MKIKITAKMLWAVQRTTALWVTSAYRTIDSENDPNRFSLIKKKKNMDVKTNIARRKEPIWQENLGNWLHRWNSFTRGSWTANLIPNKNYINKEKGEVNYYLTRMQSIHIYPYFWKYFHRMNTCYIMYSACMKMKMSTSRKH